MNWLVGWLVWVACLYWVGGCLVRVGGLLRVGWLGWLGWIGLVGLVGWFGSVGLVGLGWLVWVACL